MSLKNYEPRMPPPIDIGLHLNLTSSGFGSGVRYDYYVDSVIGSDSNDGLSPATAFATVDAFIAATTSNKGASVGFKRGQRHLPASSDSYSFSGRWGAYGSGHLPFFDCSQPITGTITPHGTHANVYVVEQTHAVALHLPGAPTASNGPHVGMWWETAATGILGQYLTPIFNAADVTAAELFVKNNPGRCFIQKVGSSTMDIRNETSATVVRYVFQLADSSDPRVGGTMRYACYRAMRFIWTQGAQVSDLAFGRCTGKDQTGVLDNPPDFAKPLVTFRRCVWLDTGCHANVGPSNWYNCIAYTRTLSRSNGAGGWHNFTGNFEQRVPVCEDSFISGYFHGVYSHGVDQNPVMQQMIGRRLWMDNCATCFTIPPTAATSIFEDIKITDCDIILWRVALVRRFTASFKALSVGQRREVFGTFQAPCGTLEDGVIKFPQTAECFITPFTGASQANAEALGTPTLRRITVTPHNAQAGTTGSTMRYINYVFEDTVGIRALSTTDPNSTNLFLDATATNSYVGPTTTGGTPLFANLAAFQAKVPGIGNDVVMFDETKPVTFAGDPLVDPTITGPAEILGRGMGATPSLIQALPTLLSNVPTLQSVGVSP